MVVKAAGCAGQGILILAWLETRDHFNPFALRAFQSRLSRASMVKSCRRARGLNPFTLNSCPPHSSRSEASSSCRPRRTQWPLVLQTGWRLRYLWRRWVQLVHFCCEARFTHSVVAPEILDRYCQHDSPHQGGLSPPLAGVDSKASLNSRSLVGNQLRAAFFIDCLADPFRASSRLGNLLANPITGTWSESTQMGCLSGL